MTSGKHIVILGNSVPLKIRPPRCDADDCTYAESLRERGWLVENRSCAASTITEAFHCFDDNVLSVQPDYLTIHYGIVEACFRQLPRKLHYATFRNIYPNRILGRDYQPRCGLTYVRVLSARIACWLVERVAKLCGIRWRWVSDVVFLGCLHDIIRLTMKETHAHVVIVGISPCGERIQRHLPGTSESIATLNEKMRDLACSYLPRVRYLDVCALFRGRRLDELVPGGIHFSGEGQRIMAEAMASIVGV